MADALPRVLMALCTARTCRHAVAAALCSYQQLSAPCCIRQACEAGAKVCPSLRMCAHTPTPTPVANRVLVQRKGQ